MDSLHFPVVSFAPFLNGSECEQREVARQLYDAFHVYGWVYLRDFGIPDHEVQQLFAKSKAYFSRPLELKMRDRLVDVAVNQGYTADGTEEQNGKRNHKESFEYRKLNHRCPNEEELPGFKPFLDRFYGKLDHLSKEVLRALAIVLNLSPAFFDPLLERADPQLRLLHYMPTPLTTLTSPNHARISPHTDYGFCTILFQDAVGGLEVDPFHNGDFVPATPCPGTCLINIADLLQRLSNDRLRSTIHRVEPPRWSAAETKARGEPTMAPSRYSAAFFVHPSEDVTIEPILGEGDTVAKYAPVNAREYRIKRMASAYTGLSVSM